VQLASSETFFEGIMAIDQFSYILASISNGRKHRLQAIISLPRITNDSPHPIPFFAIERSRAEKTVILRSGEDFIFVYENRLFADENMKDCRQEVERSSQVPNGGRR
jgi:hypothetical protein